MKNFFKPSIKKIIIACILSIISLVLGLAIVMGAALVSGSEIALILGFIVAGGAAIIAELLKTFGLFVKDVYSFTITGYIFILIGNAIYWYIIISLISWVRHRDKN